MSVCFKFSQLCFCQILFRFLYRWESYNKNKQGKLFIETHVIIHVRCTCTLSGVLYMYRYYGINIHRTCIRRTCALLQTWRKQRACTACTRYSVNAPCRIYDHRRRSWGAWGLSPATPNFSQNVWMCIESQLLKVLKKIVKSTHKVIILIFV